MVDIVSSVTPTFQTLSTPIRIARRGSPTNALAGNSEPGVSSSATGVGTRTVTESALFDESGSATAEPVMNAAFVMYDPIVPASIRA